MNASRFAAGLYIALKESGVTIDNMIDLPGSLIMYISVPETSEKTMADGRELSGMTLAHRTKEMLLEMGITNLTVKAKVRKGEHWTESKSLSASRAAMEELFGKEAFERAVKKWNNLKD